MKLFNKITYLLLTGALIASCSSSGTGSDGGGNGGNTPTTYSLTTSVNPSNSGSVSPSGGTFDEGTSISIDATAASGYEFVDWTGDIQSSDNPLNFDIDSDTDITANFQQLDESQYTMDLTVEDDSSNSQDLKFGQMPNATSDFDQGIDAESPPPPAGGIHNFFRASPNPLLWDFRNNTTASITWNLQLEQSEGDSLFFSWTLNETFLNGSLTLRNNDSSISVDMLTESSLRIGNTDADSLLIDYELGN